jgi:hypothetical protein
MNLTNKKGSVNTVTPEDLTWEERNHLYKLSAIPMFCVFLAFLIYFNYLMYTDPLETRLEFITLIGLPFFISFPMAGILSYEILYCRMVKRSLRFDLKRFVGRTFFLLVSGFWFFSMLLIMQPVLSPIIGDSDFLVSIFLSLIIFALIVVRFRRIVSKLDRGEW